MTDPISDMLTRIRNALMAGHRHVEMPSSRIKSDIAAILKEEGYIEAFEVLDRSPQNALKVTLKYGPGGERLINGIERISKPGRRVYCAKDEIPTVLNGIGTAIVSTSRGVLSGRASRRMGIGGEIICQVW